MHLCKCIIKSPQGTITLANKNKGDKKTMSTNTIEKKIAELKELEEMANEIKNEIETIKDELKMYLQNKTQKNL